MNGIFFTYTNTAGKEINIRKDAAEIFCSCFYGNTADHCRRKIKI